MLRKKPDGQLVSQTAHQVEREYTVLAAIHKHSSCPTTAPESRVPVPEVFVLCEDSDVIGTPFYIMEFLEGRIFTDMSMPGVSPQVRREWCAPPYLYILVKTDARATQLARCGARARCVIVAGSARSRFGDVRLSQAVFPAADPVALESVERTSGRAGYRYG